MTKTLPATRAAKGVSALAGLILLLVAVPAALWVFVGWPLPHGVPSWGELGSALTTRGIPDEALIKALAVAFWLAWGGLVTSVLAEVAAVVAGRQARRLAFAGPLQRVAARLVAAVLLLAPLASRLSATQAPALGVMLTRSSAAASVVHPAVPEPEPTVEERARAASELQRYTVRRRDTLWGIAASQLGDPYRWPELFELNRGRPQPDGGALTSPGMIRPGWTLSIPSSSTDVASDAGRGSDDLLEAGADSDAQPSAVPATPRFAAQADGRSTSGSDGIAAPSDAGVRLPSGSVVSLSLAAGVGASLAAARLHRRRRYAPEEVASGIVMDDPLATPAVRRLRRAALQAQTGSSSATPSAVVPGRVKSSDDDRPEVGTRLDVSTGGGSGVSGTDALRAALVECLGSSAPHECEVVVAGDELAQRLFPGVAPFTGYEVASSLDEAVGRLEVELVHRRRLTEGDEVVDFVAVVARYPEEPLPSVLLVAEAATATQMRRLDAVLDAGANLGIRLLTLDPGPPVAGSGEGGDVCSTVAYAHSGQSQGSLSSLEAAELLTVVAAGRGQTVASLDTPVEPEAFVVESVAAGPVSVEVLGTYRIVVSGREVGTGLRAKARELLALLLVRPAGMRAEAAVACLWPDSDPKRGMEGFRTAVSNLRKTLRNALGEPGTEVVERVGDRYALVASAFDCDLWQFQAALAEARNASSADIMAASLARAAAAYGGDLVGGSYYEWAEPAREDLRRRALDALVRLAKLQDADPEKAAATLEQAIQIDPYGEDLYRRLMRLQLRLDRPDAVRRTFRRLETRLGELDADPDDKTLVLLAGIPPRRRQARAGSGVSR